MVATVTFNGNGGTNGLISNADSTTGWSALKLIGGGQSPSPAAADGSFEGTGAVTCVVNKQRVVLYYDLGAGNELDFSGGGTEEGEILRIWASFLAPGLLNSQSAGGFGVFLESNTPGTGQYHLYYFDGNDTYQGGFKQFLLDPTETASASAGTALNTASIRYIGIFADVGASTARFDNLICDAIYCGTGITITGTSTTDDTFGDILADDATNKYGVISPLNEDESAIELSGKLVFGDDTGTLATTLTDVNKKIFLVNPTYYDGTSVTTSVPVGYFGLSFVGNATGATNITLGKAVGTDQGRNGITIVGNDNYTLNFDRDDGAVEAADLYGCTLEKLSGTINLDGNHDFNGVTMVDCSGLTLAVTGAIKSLTSVLSGQIDLSNGGTITDSLIINNDAAISVLTDDLADCTGNSFISDGSNHAVQMTGAAGTYTWDNTLTSYDAGTTGNGVQVTGGSITGNEAINITATTGTFTINVAAGATTPSVASAGAVVNVVVGQTNFKFTVNPSITGYEWRLYEDSATGGVIGTVELDGEESATADNQTYTYTHTVDTDIVVQVIAVGYEEFLYYGTLTNVDQDLTFNLEIEENT
jgi:hypothetical protein